MAKRSGMWRQWFGAAAVGAAVLMGANGGAWGQGAKPDVVAMAVEEAGKRNREVARLYVAGKYDEAVPLAERALALGERVVGKNDPSVAILLNNYHQPISAHYHARKCHPRSRSKVLPTIPVAHKVPV